MTVTRRLVLGGIAATAAVLTTTGSARAATTLRLAHTHPERSNFQTVLLEMADEVREQTGGEVNIQLYPAGMLGSSSSIVDGVRGGTIDMCLTGNAWPTSVISKLNVLDLPYLFANRAHVDAVIDGEAGELVRALFGDVGLVSPATFDIGFRQITNSVRAVRTPDDVGGLKIRTPSAPIPIRTFEMLGAVVTPMSFTELFSALETGTVDGQENPLSSIIETNIYEVQSHVSITNHQYTAAHLLVNANRAASLSDEHMGIITEAARAASRHQRELNAADDIASVDVLRGHGVEVTEDVDVEAFRALVAETIADEYVAQDGPELYDAIIAAKAD